MRHPAPSGRLFPSAASSPWSGGVTCGRVFPDLDSLLSTPITESHNPMNQKHNPFAAITDSPLRQKSGWLQSLAVPLVCGWLCTVLALWQFMPLAPSVVVGCALTVNLLLWSDLRRL